MKKQTKQSKKKQEPKKKQIKKQIKPVASKEEIKKYYKEYINDISKTIFEKPFDSLEREEKVTIKMNLLVRLRAGEYDDAEYTRLLEEVQC